LINFDFSKVGKVSSIMQSPADPSMFIFMGTKGINWITEDCGETITVLNTGRKLTAF